MKKQSDTTSITLGEFYRKTLGDKPTKAKIKAYVDEAVKDNDKSTARSKQKSAELSGKQNQSDENVIHNLDLTNTGLALLRRDVTQSMRKVVSVIDKSSKMSTRELMLLRKSFEVKRREDIKFRAAEARRLKDEAIRASFVRDRATGYTKTHRSRKGKTGAPDVISRYMTPPDLHITDEDRITPSPKADNTTSNIVSAAEGGAAIWAAGKLKNIGGKIAGFAKRGAKAVGGLFTRGTAIASEAAGAEAATAAGAASTILPKAATGMGVRILSSISGYALRAYIAHLAGKEIGDITGDFIVDTVKEAQDNYQNGKELTLLQKLAVKYAAYATDKPEENILRNTKSSTMAASTQVQAVTSAQTSVQAAILPKEYETAITSATETALSTITSKTKEAVAELEKVIKSVKDTSISPPPAMESKDASSPSEAPSTITSGGGSGGSGTGSPGMDMTSTNSISSASNPATSDMSKPSSNTMSASSSTSPTTSTSSITPSSGSTTPTATSSPSPSSQITSPSGMTGSNLAENPMRAMAGMAQQALSHSPIGGMLGKLLPTAANAANIIMPKRNTPQTTAITPQKSTTSSASGAPTAVTAGAGSAPDSGGAIPEQSSAASDTNSEIKPQFVMPSANAQSAPNQSMQDMFASSMSKNPFTSIMPQNLKTPSEFSFGNTSPAEFINQEIHSPYMFQNISGGSHQTIDNSMSNNYNIESVPPVSPSIMDYAMNPSTMPSIVSAPKKTPMASSPELQIPTINDIPQNTRDTGLHLLMSTDDT